jgi:hypothetical protein
MAALQHIYVTAHGEWTTANWIGEKAQFGLRLAIVQDSAAPAKGSIFTIPTNGDVDLDSGTSAGTHGTLTRTWTARRGPVGNSENCDAAFQVDLAEDLWTFLDGLKARVKDSFRWTHVKIAPMLATGAYGAPSATYQYTTPIAGTSTSGTNFPPEVALAVSLRANVLGRRGRGRIYFPGLITTESASDGTVASATRTAFASAMGTLVTNLEDAPGTEEYGPLVMVTSSGSSTGVRPAEIRVGNHWDAQRRRQHQVPEVYTIQAL